MHLGAQRLEPLLVAHAEAVLFIDDEQPEVAEARIGVQQPVRGDHDVDRAALEARQHRIGGLAERNRDSASMRTGQSAKRSRKLCACCSASSVVGTSTATWRPGLHRDEGGAHRHFGLAEAHIAADHAVHRRVLGDVLRARCAMASAWSGVSSNGKALAKAWYSSSPARSGAAWRAGAARMQIQQFRGHVAHRFGGAARGARPLVGAQLVQRRALRRAAGVAADQVQRVHRHVHAVAVAVFEHQELAELRRRSRMTSQAA